MYLSCDGSIVFTGDDSQFSDLSHYQCSTGWVASEDNLTFDPAEDLDPILIVNAITLGFFILTPLWLAVLGGRFLLKSLK